MSLKQFSPLLCLLLAGSVATAAEESIPPAQWLPSDAVIAVELFQPKALLTPLLDEKTRGTIKAMPGYQKLAVKPGFTQFLQILTYLEMQLNVDWPDGLTKLTGGGVAFALSPQQKGVLIVDAQDESILAKLHEILWTTTVSKPGAVTSSQQIGDVPTWSMNPNQAHALIGKRLIAANGMDGLRSALALRGKSGTGSLASNPNYQAARKTVGPQAVGMVYLNMDALKQLPALADFLKSHKTNPLAALLFAGVTESAASANWLAIGLQLDPKENNLSLRVVSNGAKNSPNGPAAFSLPAKAGEGALPQLVVPRQIAAASLYRDLHRFYAAKDQLFPDRTSGLIFFENMMGIFFSGRDLTDDILAQAKPEIRFIVANQQYDPAVGTPAVKIPAFAAILQLHHPEKFRETMEEAWQKAVGLSSFTRGQQALPGFIIDRPTHAGQPFTIARFSSASITDHTKLDSRFNYRPSLAMPGNYLILSSTEGLARDLIDAVNREASEPVRPIAQTNTLLEADGEQLAAVLEANRVNLVRESLIKEGGSEGPDSAGLDAIIGLAKYVDFFRLSIDSDGSLSQLWVELKLKHSLPATPAKVAEVK